PTTLPSTGQTLTLAATRGTTSIWAEDLATDKRRNLSAEEDRAFWAWATIEVLRATGIRIEELTELSPSHPRLLPAACHRPTGAPAADHPVQDRRRTAPGHQPRTRRRAQHHHPPHPQPSGAIPLAAVYDDHERLWLPPAPSAIPAARGIGKPPDPNSHHPQ